MGRRYHARATNSDLTGGQDFNLVAGVNPIVDVPLDIGAGFNGVVYAVARANDGKLYVGGSFTTYKGATNNYIIRLNADGTKDTSFDNTTGFNGVVYSIATTSDDKIYVGGDFTTYKGATNNYIIRLNSDGSKDTSFDNSTGFNTFVWSIVPTAEGKLYVGGNFTTYKGATENKIIRLNNNGAKDTTFDNSTGFNTTSIVYVIVPTAEGKLYVGGNFTTYKGATNNRIIRLNSDGSKDTTFNNGSFSVSSAIFTIVVTSDSKVYVGGQFTSYNSVTNNYIVRLNSDGTKDTSFDNTTGFNSTVYSIAITSDGKIYVGGNFTTYKGVTNNYIIRLSSDGSKDTEFDNSTGFSTFVSCILLTADNNLYVGGDFATYKGTTQNDLTFLNPQGTFYTDSTQSVTVPANSTNTDYFYTPPLHPGPINFREYAANRNWDIGDGFNSTVYSIIPTSDGKVYVGGNFTTYKGETNNCIIRLNSDGTKDTSFDNSIGFNNVVYSIVPTSDGIYVCGNFTTYKGQTNNRIIRLTTSGSKDTAFDNSTGFNSVVYSIAPTSDGIYVGGGFSSYKGVTNNRIIRLSTNGSKDTGFDNTTGFNNPVWSIAPTSDGIYVGGFFTTYKGVTENRIIRLTTSGSKDTAFDNSTGFNNTVFSIAPTSDGIYVGGQFTTYKGQTENYIIRLTTNGSKDTGFDNSTGFNNVVYSIAPTSSGIYVGGQFTTYKGQTNNLIIRLTTTGSKDTGFDNTTGFSAIVYSIAPSSDGKVYVGGDFVTYKTQPNNYLTLLNSDGSHDYNFITEGGFNNVVYSIAITSDGKVYVGGAFTTYKGQTNNYIIRLNADGTKDTNFDNSTGFNNIVYSIASTSDGKVYVGGTFTLYKGVTNNYIIRLNSDGTKDTTFDNTTGFNAGVYSILPTTTAIYVGGNFTTYKGATENYIIRLTTTGSKDTGFDNTTGFNGIVLSIASTSDGIYVGGGFTTYKGQTENRIIRLTTSGSKDTAFDNSTGFDLTVYSIAPTSSGIYVGGQFTTYKGQTENRIIRLNTNGSKDTAFDNSTGFGADVRSITPTSSGIYVGGLFTTYKGQTENRIIRLNTNGSKDTAFDNSTGFGGTVLSIVAMSDGKLYVGGGFTSYKGQTENRMIRLNSDGNAYTLIRSAQYPSLFNIKFSDFNSSALSIVPTSDGKVYVGGGFTTYKGQTNNYIIRLNSDGSKDTAFDNTTGFNNAVRFIVPTSDGIYVGGDFTTYKGQTENRIIRLNTNGSKDTAFDNSTGFGGSVISIAPTSDGIYVGGTFTTYKGVTENYIIRLSTNGSKDTAFDNTTGFNNAVRSIVPTSDGIYVGGNFTLYKGVTENYIIRLTTSGSKDTGFDNSTGFNNFVERIASTSDGIYVGGFFSTYKGATNNRIIRLSTNGSKDTGFDNSTGFNNNIFSIVPTSDGIYVGGNFTLYKGVTENYIIRLTTSGSKDTSFDNSTGFNSAVNSIAPTSDGKVYVGGDFTTYKGASQIRIAQLQPNGAILNQHPQFFLNLQSGANLTLSAALEKIDTQNNLIRTFNAGNSIILPTVTASTSTFTTAGTTSSTVPAGAVTATVRAWGGGGGGGGRNNTGTGGAGGGGGGAYAESTFAVTPGQTISVTVGAAGTAGSTANGNGGNGGNSTATYASVVRVNAGGGVGGTGGVGGAGGTGGVVNVGTGFVGGNANAGNPGISTDGGGGGGGAGTTGEGGQAVQRLGGVGTTLSGGNGGDGGINAAGSNGSVAGGGGGGGSRTAGGAKAGGAGAIGRVEITYRGAEPTYSSSQLFYFPALDLGEFMRSERLRIKLTAQNTTANSETLIFKHRNTYTDFPANTIQRRST